MLVLLDGMVQVYPYLDLLASLGLDYLVHILVRLAPVLVLPYLDPLDLLGIVVLVRLELGFHLDLLGSTYRLVRMLPLLCNYHFHE